MEAYPKRESINSKAFAIRHMIIEELKYRKSQKDTDEDTKQRMSIAARGLGVAPDNTEKQYLIKYNSSLITRIGFDEISLFSHDANPPVNNNETYYDPILEANRKRIMKAVDVLLAADIQSR